MTDWTDPLADFDSRSPPVVAEVFRAAAEANRDAACRRGAVDVVGASGLLLATGDLHDNPLHFARVVQMAGLPGAAGKRPHHLTLHEVIHSERLVGGVDLSHRALLRVAALKMQDPEEVHTLLANHELSQIVGAGIVKDGVRVVDAFNEGVRYVFGDEADAVSAAIAEFIRSMPLALLSEPAAAGPIAGRRVLCAHSLPAPELMDRFDPSILDRDLVEEDYEPRRGSAHLMVWGRNHRPEHLDALAERWGVGLFILGHEHAPEGWRALSHNAIVLNSDHAAGVALPIDLESPPAAADAPALVRPLAPSR